MSLSLPFKGAVTKCTGPLSGVGYKNTNKLRNSGKSYRKVDMVKMRSRWKCLIVPAYPTS